MNLQNLTSYAWLTAGAAGVFAFWNQIKAAVQGSFTWFLTTSTLTEDVSQVVMAYLRKNCREVVLGSRTYGMDHYFLRSIKKWGGVAVERSAKGKIFMRGWLPIFVTVSSSEGNDGPKAKTRGNIAPDVSSSSKELTVTSLRWFFDFERFITEAVTMFNRHEYGRGHRRYCVFRLTGDMELNHVSEQGHGGNNLALGVRVIGHDPADLGEPVPKSPFEHLTYPEAVNKAVAQVKDWLGSKDWYEERVIGWRIGMLLTGLPGTGKTSCAKALAQELDLPVYVLDLTTMGNQDLVRSWAQARDNAPAMVLLEDLDRVNVAKDDVAPPIVSRSDDKKSGFSFKPALTLDCLLNCISGIERSDGILVVATSNDSSKLDPALTRPGRMDIIVEFPSLNEEARFKIARRILPPTPELVDEVVAAGDGETGAQFTKRCADKALELYWATRR